MATIERLTKRPDFLAAAEGRRFHTERMSAQGRLRDPGGVAGLRLGFTITKRVGHATERNRIRRRLRAVVALVASDLPVDLAGLPADIVLVARRPALGAAFATLAEDLRRAIPAVTRPSSGPRGDRRPKSSGLDKKSSGLDKTSSGPAKPIRPPAAEAPRQSAPSGKADTALSHGRDKDFRITGVPGSDRTGGAPVATPNACGGVPDGQ